MTEPGGRIGGSAAATFLSADRRDALVAAFVGVAVFLLYCDVRILDPREISWVLSGDPGQQFLGWQFFRNTSWLQFPLGANPTCGTEQPSSIVYTDSLPLLAFAFKAVRGVLPDPFQYQGLWILSCFVLQPLFAWRLLGRFTDDRTQRLLGAALFALAPPMLWRLHGHYALLAHWMIVAALAEVFESRHRPKAWALLLGISALTHAYLLAMVAAIGCADLVQRVRCRERTRRQAVFESSAAVAGLILLLWVVGYFLTPRIAGGSYGYFRMNLLAPIDPEEIWSRILPDQPAAGKGDYEGFNYLGLASWGLLFACSLRLLGRDRPRLDPRRYAPLIGLGVGFALFAVSHRVAFGAHELFSIPIGDRIEQKLGILRSSGRIFWPIVYLLYLGGMVWVWRLFRRRTAVVLTVSLLALQCVDQSASMAWFRQNFDRTLAPKPAALASAFWEEAAGRYRRIVFVTPTVDLAGAERVLYFAATRDLPVNVAYTSRTDLRRHERTQAAIERALRAGRVDGETLYVFVDRDALWRELRRKSGRSDLVAVVDGYSLLAPGMGRFVLGRQDRERTGRRMWTRPRGGGSRPGSE
ncbi:MAG: hypothetical protein AMXMBFR36_36970 [Acidobacteriota bacterium]